MDQNKNYNRMIKNNPKNDQAEFSKLIKSSLVGEYSSFTN